MIAHHLFAALTNEQAEEVFGWLHEHDRPTYRSCISLLATRRKLRPIFIERKQRRERHEWLKDAFSRQQNSDIATEVLQSWILKAHGAMVCKFLKMLDIAHDGNGLVETFPPQPPVSDINKAVEVLYRDYPSTAVFIYLNLFVGLKIADWPEFEKIVQSHPQLCLKPHTQNL